MTDDTEIPFWRRKTLKQMTSEEWESLCDGCGKCCLNKLQEEDDPLVTYYTDVGCVLLDGDSGRCCDYPNRQAIVKDCVQLTPRNLKKLHWLPPSCGYRLVSEGKDLYWWHHLVSGDPDTVHQAGISVKGKVGANEKDVPDDDLEKHIVRWPLKWPKGARRKPFALKGEDARRKPVGAEGGAARRKPFAPKEEGARMPAAAGAKPTPAPARPPRNKPARP